MRKTNGKDFKEFKYTSYKLSFIFILVILVLK